MKLESLVGQTLDEKYQIERELGRGGMGAVFLSTHLGTGRHVAVKVIVPQFMERAEFVERFRREARAAGRLRHPNVVDVTDFGFADTPDGRVAYLVMEYLDGCTLGEILEEEKQLPLQWTLDILEQVGSAIHEAHQQGIIHRDLKPDNIWLEPNQRGGYTVKVLDFGIAKLETAGEDSAGRTENSDRHIESAPTASPAQKTQSFGSKHTVSDEGRTNTLLENNGATLANEKQTAAEIPGSKTLLMPEASTLIQPLAVEKSPEKDTTIDMEAGTAIFSPAVAAPAQFPTAKQESEAGTRLISEQIGTGTSVLSKKSTAELTRVGAVLGTPLYMSPEQCRGEKLSPQSDIYSLGVIAYQMLGGKTPFTGDYLEVMKAHKEAPAPDLEAKKVPKKVKQVIESALAKNVEERPPSAQAFTNKLRAQSEGFGTLFRRALEIYSKHLPSFLLLAVLLHAPLTLFTFLQVAAGFLPGSGLTIAVVKGVIGLAVIFASLFCGSILVGTTTWLVAQVLAFPLKPVRLRPALQAARKQWKNLVKTSLLSGLLTLLGYSLCFFPGLILSVLWSLAASVVMMENLKGRAALRRSKNLVKRSLPTGFAIVLTTFFVPIVLSLFIGFFAKSVVGEIAGEPEKVVISKQKDRPPQPSAETPTASEEREISINMGGVKITEGEQEKLENNKLKYAVREALTQIIYLPISILILSLFTIAVSLFYLKTRQSGGESMQDLLAQFEENDHPHSNWQKRVRDRLLQSGRVTSRGGFSKKSGEQRTTEGA